MTLTKYVNGQVIDAAVVNQYYSLFEGGLVFDVKNRYGAVGNNAAVDTTAAIAARDAAVAAGAGVILFPPIYSAGVPVPYLLNQSLILTSDNIEVWGLGWSSIVKAANGLNADLIATPTAATSVRNNIGIRNLRLDGNKANQTSGNIIHLYGTRYSVVEGCMLVDAKSYGLNLDGDGVGFGYQNSYLRNTLQTCEGGITEQNSEGEFFIGNIIKGATSLHPVYLNSGAHHFHANIVGNEGAYTGPALELRNSLPSEVVGNRFDQSRHQAIKCSAGNQIIIGNQIYKPCSSTSNVDPVIELGSTKNVVTGNIISDVGAGATWNYCFLESGAADNNLIQGNQIVPGLSGTVSLIGTHTQVRSNPGYNPVGTIAAGAVPASTTAKTNSFGVDATVFIAGGTVTVIAIGGTTTGLTSGAFRVPAGQTITITYSVVPTWTWFGD